MAGVVAAYAPRVGRVAVVCALRPLGDARSREDAPRIRGLQVAVFTDEVEVRRRLDEGPAAPAVGR
jgi:hypothetical protein